MGRRIRSKRIAAGLSQVELAARADIGLQTVGLAERLDCASRGTLDRIAAALGTSLEELLP